ncbi:MAG: twin-arginine translocation signal domain-containing protein [Planctomycetes bacterium]|nr:twin-arginine translocation signal domain-containing protein [Planctomycetota bacterium]MBL7145519.1 twin-arginine translocation signal domain-containing protein [Phycisphaerae bacterium]
MNNHSLTRRDFLKKSAITAGAVAFPYFIPASALGADGVNPSDKIVVGYWGTGSQGSGNAKGFTGKSDVQAVAVCDVNPGGTNYAGNRLAGREPTIKAIEDMYAKQKGAG